MTRGCMWAVASPAPGRSDSLAWDVRASQRRTVALPYTSLRLEVAKPRVFPRGYPHDPHTLGQRVRQRRMDLGLTQQTLARKLGCSSESVAVCEGGASDRTCPWGWSRSRARRAPQVVSGPLAFGSG